MESETKLRKVLVELWDNDDEVPDAVTRRCTELNWFSGGVKNNIIAHIAIEVFGKEEAMKMLNPEAKGYSLK